MHALRSPLRSAVVAASAVVLAAALVGCGSDDKDSGKDVDKDAAPKVEVLSELEVTSALMVESNLGGLFKVEPETQDDNDDDDGPGCLADVSDFLNDDSDDAETTAERDFEAVDENTNVSVSNKVFSYSTTAEAEKAIDGVMAALEDCTEVAESDDDGYTYELEVTSDDEKSEDSVDDQVNSVTSGTISIDDQSGEIALYLSLVRVDNNITAVSAVTLDSELPGPITDLVEVVTDRLAAVVDGKQPDDSVVAGQ